MTGPVEPVRIGLVSDTHGLWRPQVARVLAGVDLILHAGDVGGPRILSELARIAPVHAVFGNTDLPGDPMLQARFDFRSGGLLLHVSHGHELGGPTPEKLAAAYDADVVVFGHTHRALVRTIGRRLIVNPGAAGPRRFDLRPSVGILTIEGGRARAEIVPLEIEPPRAGGARHADE